MEITTSLKINNRGEVLLYLLSFDESDPCNDFVVVEKDSEKDDPYLKLHYEGNQLKLLKKRDIENSEDELKEIIHSLLIEVVRAKSNGEEIPFDITEDSSIRPYDPESIRIEPKAFSLRQILELIDDGDLNLTPDFQRYLVWDNKRKSRLIESILLKIPLPVFYFSEDDEGRFTVVDGLQRLSAISEFMQNKLKLEKLEYLKTCEGKTYSGLKNDEDKFFRRFNSSQISVNVITSESPSKLKYDIFKRLNTGGISLNMQEIRNCFLNSKLRTLLKSMVTLPSFKLATANMSDARMQAQEMALRYIMFANLMDKKTIDAYTGNMDDDLDSCVDSLNEKNDFDEKNSLNSFDRAMQNAFYLFGKHCFRKVHTKTNDSSPRSILNKLLFECWSVTLSKFDPVVIKTKFNVNSFVDKLGVEIDEDHMFNSYISYGTNGKTNVVYCMNKVNDMVNNLFNVSEK